MGLMACKACDSTYNPGMLDEILELKKAYEASGETAAGEIAKPDETEQNWDISAIKPWEDAQADGIRTYVCSSCGGEIIAEANTAATRCPFCDSPVVLMDKLSGLLKPDLVIPFKINREEARNALKQHFKGKRLLPSVFRNETHIEEIKGVYIPVWLFDTTVEANALYGGIKIRHWSDFRYDYTETSYYKMLREGVMEFSGIPVDGSEKMPDIWMESIEPFEVSAAEAFTPAYLSGYVAERYDVEANRCLNRIQARAKKTVQDRLRRSVSGYASVNMREMDEHFKEGHIRYALYPVWILHTKWEGNTYSFIMNGQTGRFAGDLPVDKKRRALYFAGITAACMVFSMLLMLLINLL